MSEIAARCRDCGYEQYTEFPSCPVCGAASSSWWCGSCREWRDNKACSVCNGSLVVPREVNLGAFPVGSHIPVRFVVRNPSKKPVDFEIEAHDTALSLPVGGRTLRGFESADVHGTLHLLARFPPGPLQLKVQFNTAIPAETTLVVRVVPAVVRLDFAPAEAVFRSVVPGKVVRRTVDMKNTGNVPVAVKLSSSQPWLSVQPEHIELAHGGSATLKIAAKTKRTDSGERIARILATVESGETWEVPVRVRLPEPKLEAVGPTGLVSATSPIDLGKINPDRATYESVTLRNVGKVRVACVLASDQPWLAVTPKRVTLPPGREKIVKVRAMVSTPITSDSRGLATISVTQNDRELLQVPVSAEWHIPKPILAPIRRQTIGQIANDGSVVRRFSITNSGDGRLHCTVTASVPWIEVVTTELTIGPEKKRRVEFQIDAPNMPLGKSVATLRVRSDGGDLDVPLSVVVVEPQPELEVLGDAELGTLAGSSGTGFLSVRNIGVGLLKLRAEPEVSRITVTPKHATIAPGLPFKLAVSVSVEGLAGGEHASGVHFLSNGGTGWAAVRFRLPVEDIQLPSMINLGDRAAGQPTGDALRIQNTGTDPVVLRLRSEDSSLSLGTEQVSVRPGELLAVPFRVELPRDTQGSVGWVILVEGRTLRRSVAVRAVARKIELVVIPPVVVLGDMAIGEERTIAIQLVNMGDLPAEVRDSHTSGELEVWVRKLTVQPATGETLSLRVRLNARVIGKQVRAVVPLAHEASVRFTAVVARPMMPRIAAGLAVTTGLILGGLLGSSVGWLVGGAVAIAGFVVAAVLLTTDVV
ncbi:MAG: hypothetical protein K8U57_25595 [Planctomycetes bacterium]|nr:hypothetical protein [Planctomycetota bacterium]